MVHLSIKSPDMTKLLDVVNGMPGWLQHELGCDIADSVSHIMDKSRTPDMATMKRDCLAGKVSPETLVRIHNVIASEVGAGGWPAIEAVAYHVSDPKPQVEKIATAAAMAIGYAASDAVDGNDEIKHRAYIGAVEAAAKRFLEMATSKAESMVPWRERGEVSP